MPVGDEHCSSNITHSDYSCNSFYQLRIFAMHFMWHIIPFIPWVNSPVNSLWLNI